MWQSLVATGLLGAGTVLLVEKRVTKVHHDRVLVLTGRSSLRRMNFELKRGAYIYGNIKFCSVAL